MQHCANCKLDISLIMCKYVLNEFVSDECNGKRKRDAKEVSAEVTMKNYIICCVIVAERKVTGKS